MTNIDTPETETNTNPVASLWSKIKSHPATPYVTAGVATIAAIAAAIILTSGDSDEDAEGDDNDGLESADEMSEISS